MAASRQVSSTAGPQQAARGPEEALAGGSLHRRPPSLGSEPEGKLVSRPRPADRRGQEEARADYSTGAESRTLLLRRPRESRPATCCGSSGGLRRGGRRAETQARAAEGGAGRGGGVARATAPTAQGAGSLRSRGGRVWPAPGSPRFPPPRPAPRRPARPRPSRGRSTLTGSGASEGRKRRRGRGGGGGGRAGAETGVESIAAPQPLPGPLLAIPRLCLRTSAPSVKRAWSITDKHHFLTLDGAAGRGRGPGLPPDVVAPKPRAAGRRPGKRPAPTAPPGAGDSPSGSLSPPRTPPLRPDAQGELHVPNCSPGTHALLLLLHQGAAPSRTVRSCQVALGHAAG